jgi:SAM-dependent methyltransferase
VSRDESIWRDDPVKAYDAVAQSFALLTAERRAYLDAIDRLAISNIPRGAKTLLDAGAGDARRSRLIAAAAGCSVAVLAEPSAGMRRASSSPAGYVDLRIESLHQLEGEFDVILCLWNVLGHVFPAAARAAAMAQFRRLLSPRARLFVDVNHRYNAARYGFMRTAGRFIHDVVRPSEGNGDVLAKWQLDGAEYGVRGHVFTAIEFVELAEAAGLSVEHRFVVDYETGAERDFAIQGNLLYVMKRDQ